MTDGSIGKEQQGDIVSGVSKRVEDNLVKLALSIAQGPVVSLPPSLASPSSLTDRSLTLVQIHGFTKLDDSVKMSVIGKVTSSLTACLSRCAAHR